MNPTLLKSWKQLICSFLFDADTDSWCHAEMSESTGEQERLLAKGGSLMTNMQVEYSKLVEQSRHNRATEALTDTEIREKARTNRANEQLRRDELNETMRHNGFSEAEIARSNRANEQLKASEIEARVAIADLQAQTQLNVERMREANATEIQKMQNETNSRIARANRQVTKLYNDGRLAIDQMLADSQSSKIKAEIEKIKHDMLVNETKLGQEFDRIQIERDKFQETYDMDTWQQQMDAQYLYIREADQEMDRVSTAVDAATKIWNSAVNTAKPFGSSSASAKSKQSAAENTLGENVKTKQSRK